MASSANHFSLFILLTLLSSLQIQARDNQFFNKVSNNNNVVPTNNEPQNNQQPQEEPNFLPQNENTYGLYSHDSGHLPPSATTVKGGSPTAAAVATPFKRYLPKNYNPVAYVTEPEDINETESFTEESFNSNPENNNNYYNGEKNYYNQQQEEDSEFRRFHRPATTKNGNMYYNGGSSFNSDPQGFTGARFRGAATDREKYSNNGGYEPQGMSDTRFIENGKYFYDVNNEKFSSNHPYERLKSTRARNEFNNRNYYEQNSMEGYQNSEEFHDEENYNLP